MGSIPLDIAVGCFSGLGWVHWYVTRGREEDYWPEQDVYPDGKHLNHDLSRDGMPSDIWIELHGDKRFLFVETSAGLNLKQDYTLDAHRADLQKRLGNLSAFWDYVGSGGYRMEISPDTDQHASAWSHHG